MKYKSEILPKAKVDLKNAALWYDEKQKGLGRQLVKKFRERVGELKTNPLVCQIRYSEVHTALVEQFPYMIHYYVDQQNKTIVIISILHTSRDPKIWFEK